MFQARKRTFQKKSNFFGLFKKTVLRILVTPLAFRVFGLGLLEFDRDFRPRLRPEFDEFPREWLLDFCDFRDFREFREAPESARG
jgi:hypothetical protein